MAFFERRRFLNVTDADLFDAMNLDLPGLKHVQAAVNVGDHAGAWKAWGNYISERTAPQWFVDPDTYGNGMEQAFPHLAEEIVYRADLVHARESVPPMTPRVRLHYRETGEPDYSVDPLPWDDRIGSVRNLKHLEPLPRAWLLTNDASYADCFCMHVRSLYNARNLIGAGPTGWDAWGHHLNIGLRLMAVLDGYMCLRNYRDMSPEDHGVMMRFIRGMALALLDFAVTVSDHSGLGANGVNAATTALACAGALFPEFSDSAVCVEEGSKYVERVLRETVYADGAQHELCSQYHMAVIRDMSKMARVMHSVGRPSLYSDAPGGDIFRRMHEWLAATVSNDGFHPPFHSGIYSREWLGYLLIYDKLSNDRRFQPLIRRFYAPDYMPVAKGSVGDVPYLLTPELKPDPQTPGHENQDEIWPTATHLRPSGTCILRSGSTPEDTYIGMVYGKPRSGHGYPQLGSFLMCANRRWLILHPGSGFGYSEPHYKTYYHTTFSHNTVIVDGKSHAYLQQGKPYGREVGAECRFWETNETASMLRITHDGYAQIAGIMHTRTFAFVDKDYLFIHDLMTPLDGDSSPHRYDWALHTMCRLDPLGPGRWSNSGDTGLAVAFACPEEIEPIPAEQRPCMLPVDFSRNLMATQQGLAWQHYWRKCSEPGRSISFAAVCRPFTNAEKPPEIKRMPTPDDQPGCEVYDIALDPKHEHHITVPLNPETAVTIATSKQ